MAFYFFYHKIAKLNALHNRFIQISSYFFIDRLIKHFFLAIQSSIV